MTRCLGCLAKLENQAGICPLCGYEAGKIPESPLHMAPGTILLDRYLVGKVIGYGGFGVTYIGWDSSLQQRVAIKEYLPSEFASRSMGQPDVTVFGGNKAQQFADGMAKSTDEAKRLAQFQSENGIVRVYDSFEANNTAYLIMEYLDGETLTAFLNREGKVPVEKAIELMTPVIQSLETVHKAGIIHRDIAPDNIMITKDGKVKLIDFGAARYATTSHSRSLTVIIKPGYSPEEQYRSRGDQGPHTDVYALGAVLYRMVTGETPPDALERRAFFENKKKDILIPPSKNCKIPKNIENAILNAMNVRIEDRTPNAKAFLEQLTSEAPVQRVIGKIKGIDLMKWPLWAKIIIPTGGIVVATLFALLATGKIGFPDRPIPTLPLGENMTRVPSVINYSVDTAQNELGKQALVSIISGREPSDVIPANLVMRQSINAGEIVEKNSSVELFISTAAIPVTEKGKMPDVAYYTEAEAADMLRQLGAIVSVEQEYNNDIAEGIVIRGSIATGESLSDSTEVTLYVSLGPNPATNPDSSIPDTQVPPTENAGQGSGPSQNSKPVTSNSAKSGSAGANITWAFNNGTLTLSGNGEMDIYNIDDRSGGDHPWWDFRKEIKSVIIGDGITEVGICAFYDCTNLSSVSIPNSVSTIQSFAFEGCTSLKTISIPSSVTNIREYAFYECSGLKNIELPAGITKIGSSTFHGCTSLESVSIPNGVKSIEGLAFGNCKNLKSITIPVSVSSFFSRVFEGSGLESIYYAGTESEWNEITFYTDDAIPASVNIYFN